MTLDTWLLFVLVAIAPALSPGPGVLFSVRNSLTYGPRVTILIGLVNAAGMATLGIAVGLGLGALMAASAAAFLVLKLVGAVYLIWLGIKVWRDRSALAVDATSTTRRAPMRALVSQSMAISLTNPKAMVALAALLPPFMDPALPATPQVVILALTYGALCAANHTLIAFAGGWLRRVLTSPRRHAIVRRATGSAFVGFGTALAVSSR